MSAFPSRLAIVHAQYASAPSVDRGWDWGWDWDFFSRSMSSTSACAPGTFGSSVSFIMSGGCMDEVET